MNNLIRSTLIFFIILNFVAIVHAGVSATKSFQLSVTIPPHVSTSINNIDPLTDNLSSLHTEQPLTLVETEQIVRNNQSIVLQSVVVR